MSNEQIASLGNSSPMQTPSTASAMPRQPTVHLTPRESEVVRYVMLGESNKQIARRLGISNYTVRDHVSNLLKKSGVTSRSRLALVLPTPLVQPATAAPRPETIKPTAMGLRPTDQPLHGPSFEIQKAGLPWRK